MSEKLQIFLDLTRLKKPIGYMLLFWPCAWGLTAGFNFSENLIIYFFYLILFFLGSVLMRSAGCIVNDIIDRKYDKKVERTKDRPLASGKVSVKLALFYTIFMFFRFFSFDKFQYYNNYSSFSFNAIGFHLSINEKIYLLATTFFGRNI